MEPTKFDPTSHTLTDDLKSQLKTLVPEAFTEEAIDFDRLKTLLGEMVEEGQERYSFTWPGKTQAIRAAQTPSIGTLVPDKEASEDWDTTGNLYLEGDNLEILKLLQKSYTCKVSAIFIDPPYNTGNDFVYPDNYGEGLKTYLEYTGQVDGEGKKITTNTETDGRYHSKWLNMMYPRLMLARNLLKDDGAIFISIDDHEQANLRKICDEIFGSNNFVGSIAWKKTSGDNKPSFAFTHDTILIFGKSSKELPRVPLSPEQLKQYSNPDGDGRGDWAESDYRSKWTKEERPSLYYGITNPNTGEVVFPDTYSKSPRVWACAEDTHKKNEQEGLLWWGVDGKNTEPKKKRFLKGHKGVNTRSVWLDAGTNDGASSELQVLFPEAPGAFDNPKPTELIKRIINIYQDDSLILDFFSGSGTTAHAVIKKNAEDGGQRKFILTQLQEPLNLEKKEQAIAAKFLESVGKSLNIAALGQERIKRAGAKIKAEFAEKLAERETPLDTGFRTYRLSSSTFNTWDATSDDDMQAKLLESTSLIKDDSRDEDVLTELILKSGYSLSLPVEQREIGGINAHSIADGELLIVLSGSISPEAARAIAESSPKRFIARENAFGSDADLTNTAQIMKDKGIDFRVL